MTERQVQARMLKLCGSIPHVRLFRNTVGVGYVGQPGRLTKIRFGLHNGSADLIGWRSIVITPDMVGKRVAQFVSIEVKGPKGVPTDEQRNWRFQVHDAGGFATISRDPEITAKDLTLP